MKNGKEIGRKGRKNFIPIKPNSSDISEIKQVLKKHSEYAFKYKKE
ncbi:MAG: hypothetical protein MOIL_01800 [Candidatus Methanolliviera sp. GoM_oil]|nr:MAG: hypothetical protein MOIL_01800 [Candidatus Methanolliviera sp. GoM_oil]